MPTGKFNRDKKVPKERKEKYKWSKANKRKARDLMILERRAKLAEVIKTTPMSYRKLAKMFDVSYSTIKNDIIHIENELIKRAADNLEVVKHRTVERLEFVLKESAIAWEKSKEVQRITQEKKATNSQGASDETKVQEKQTPGDPRFLDMFKETALEIANVHGVQKAENDKKITLKIEMPELPPELAKFGLSDSNQVEIEEANVVEESNNEGDYDNG